MTPASPPHSPAPPAQPLVRRVIRTPVGPLTLVASDRGLRAILWPDDREGRVPLPAGATDDPTPAAAAHLDAAETQLDEWFAGQRTEFDLATDIVGTGFQRAVWAALATIPHGATVSYAELASRIGDGDRGKARAVGAAVGRNPLSIVVPCHRVVGADGRLTGFAGGLEVKRRLLDLENGTPSLLAAPGGDAPRPRPRTATLTGRRGDAG